MVRSYKRKTDRSNINEEAISSAISEILAGKLSVRKAAEKYCLKVGTLQYRITCKRKRQVEDEGQVHYASKYTSQQVFTINQEKLLNECIVTFSKMHYGFTLTQMRQLAYQYAKMLGCRYPNTWEDNKVAGLDWLSRYRKRNPNIRLRKTENTSDTVNKSDVIAFVNNLEGVMEKYKFPADRIINFDEIGITTVLNSPKLTTEDSQQEIDSAQTGELVTFGGFITGTGDTIPPVFVFPKEHYKSDFLNDGLKGSLGLSSTSGWFNSELFVGVLHHVQKRTNCTKENPVLFICNNYEYNISIEAISYCVDNGIIYLSFPPNTSHQLQPLDVGVFDSFKTELKTAFEVWRVNQPGKTLTFSDIPGLVKLAYLESFVKKNIVNAFFETGIVPFNKLAFSDYDFTLSEVYENQESQDAIENVRCMNRKLDDAVQNGDKPTSVTNSSNTQTVPTASKGFVSILKTSYVSEPMPSTSRAFVSILKNPAAFQPTPSTSKTFVSILKRPNAFVSMPSTSKPVLGDVKQNIT